MHKELRKATITPEEAAAIFGIPRGTLANLRSQRRGCKFFKCGRRVLYRIDDFERWVTSNPVMTIDSTREKKRS